MSAFHYLLLKLIVGITKNFFCLLAQRDVFGDCYDTGRVSVRIFYRNGFQLHGEDSPVFAYLCDLPRPFLPRRHFFGVSLFLSVVRDEDTYIHADKLFDRVPVHHGLCRVCVEYLAVNVGYGDTGRDRLNRCFQQPKLFLCLKHRALEGVRKTRPLSAPFHFFGLL